MRIAVIAACLISSVEIAWPETPMEWRNGASRLAPGRTVAPRNEGSIAAGEKAGPA